MQKLIPLVFLLGSGAASAIPVTWRLNDVTFEDGRVAYGSFVYDADTNNYSDASIEIVSSLQPNTPTPSTFGGSYGYQPESLPNSSQVVGFGDDFTFSGYYGIIMRFETPLTNEGDVIAIDTDLPSALWSSAYDVSGAYPPQLVSRVTGGTVVNAVPLPAAVWLFGSGLGVLGWFRRRQTA